MKSDKNFVDIMRTRSLNLSPRYLIFLVSRHRVGTRRSGCQVPREWFPTIRACVGGSQAARVFPSRQLPTGDVVRARWPSGDCIPIGSYDLLAVDEGVLACMDRAVGSVPGKGRSRFFLIRCFLDRRSINVKAFIRGLCAAVVSAWVCWVWRVAGPTTKRKGRSLESCRKSPRGKPQRHEA